MPAGNVKGVCTPFLRSGLVSVLRGRRCFTSLRPGLRRRTKKSPQPGKPGAGSRWTRPGHFWRISMTGQELAANKVAGPRSQHYQNGCTSASPPQRYAAVRVLSTHVTRSVLHLNELAVQEHIAQKRAPSLGSQGRVADGPGPAISGGFL